MNEMALTVLKNFSFTTSFFPNNSDGYTYTILGTDGSPYLTRTLFPRVGDLRPVLHHIHRPDKDRHLHNHPWKTASFRVLSGSYLEERLVIPDPTYPGIKETVIREIKTGDINELGADAFHRIHELRGDVWTFGILGERVQEWGFMVDGIVVPHAEYAKRRT